MSDNKLRSAIIIPALNPKGLLISYCKKLIDAGFNRIILVDDGSDDEHKAVFESLRSFPECVIIEHEINQGKGRGLKDAFNYFLKMSDVSEYDGVITADADGQHTVTDVIRLAESLHEVSQSDDEASKQVLILGSRDFSMEHVPFKSRYGNITTRFVFRLLHGVKITDTQTGLRGIPTLVIPKFIDIFGERFEYETNMLIVAAHQGVSIREITIETVYEGKNEGSHFNPFKDSWAIYKLLLGTFFKFAISSVLSFLLDIGLFTLAVFLFKKYGFTETTAIVAGTVSARILSSIFNYLVNRNVVFKSNSKASGLIKYYILVVLQMCASAGLVALFVKILGFWETPVKIVVDFVLFLLSYQIQNRLIFKN